MNRGFYMHKNSMDCCIEILNINYINSEYIKVKIRWWNLGYNGTPFLLNNNTEKIKIYIKDIINWKLITENDMV